MPDSSITPSQRRHSRPLDVHRWSDHPEVNKFVMKIWDAYLIEVFAPKNGVGKRPKTSLFRQFKVVLLDFYVAWIEDPELLIAVPQTKSSFIANSRYNKLFLSSKVIEICNALVELGLLWKRTGSEVSGLTSRFWSTKKLIQHFRKAKFNYLDIGRFSDQEVIILNRARNHEEDQGKTLEYEDSDYPEIAQMRSDLVAYNELLHRSFIDIGCLDQPWVERRFFDQRSRTWKSQRVRIGHPNKFVRRIYYRADWNLGGRFHGGFWQLIDADLRKEIIINDEPTIEQDFSGLHINLCYGLKKTPAPSEDPYSLDPIISNSPATQRAWIKTLSLTAINANSEKNAYKAFRHQMVERTRKDPNDEAAQLGKGLNDNQLQLLLEAFKEKHHAIKDMICSDQGVKLMKIDGNITARVINHFTKKQVPILSVHDSYITPYDHTGELNRVMQKALQDELGDFEVAIKQEGIGMDQVQTTINMDRYNLDPISLYKSVKSSNRSNGYELRKEEFYEWLNQLKEL